MALQDVIENARKQDWSIIVDRPLKHEWAELNNYQMVVAANTPIDEKSDFRKFLFLKTSDLLPEEVLDWGMYMVDFPSFYKEVPAGKEVFTITSAKRSLIGPDGNEIGRRPYHDAFTKPVHERFSLQVFPSVKVAQAILDNKVSKHNVPGGPRKYLLHELAAYQSGLRPADLPEHVERLSKF